MSYITIPLIIFILFVAPLWLILHYRSRKHITKSLTEEDQQQLDKLLTRTEQLQHRIVSLEEILDAEVPQWRQK
ncbi:envelope stress response membrane protein PspB [Psychromonas sp. PT13]|uniref:envelope stress response membrane protein PspB n=1 Tax=Psychromonas sp. PT13 TaxID=3439547 RepID=UPI003EBC5A54